MLSRSLQIRAGLSRVPRGLLMLRSKSLSLETKKHAAERHLCKQIRRSDLFQNGCAAKLCGSLDNQQSAASNRTENKKPENHRREHNRAGVASKPHFQ